MNEIQKKLIERQIEDLKKKLEYHFSKHEYHYRRGEQLKTEIQELNALLTKSVKRNKEGV